MATRQQNRSSANGQEKKGPEQSWKVGAAGGGFIECAVWAKEVTKDKNSFVAYSVSIQRSYMDDKEVWQTTNFLRQDHVPVAIYLMQKAWEYVIETKRGGDSE